MRKENSANEVGKVERLTASVSEAAQMLGVSERMVYKLTKSGRLPHKKIGTRVLYPIDGLRRFVNETDSE